MQTFPFNNGIFLLQLGAHGVRFDRFLRELTLDDRSGFTKLETRIGTELLKLIQFQFRPITITLIQALKPNIQK